MAGNVLLICGSLNQTTIMHQISRHLNEYKCSFAPFYSDGVIDLLARNGLLNRTILGGQHLQNCVAYLNKESLPLDWRGESHEDDLVVTCTDLLLQRNIRGKRIILVQEGMIDNEGFLYGLVRDYRLPRFLANTAATGLSNGYDLFCVASQGYRDLFVSKGVHPEKIRITGIPNFDDAQNYLENDFPYRNYILVATCSNRESLKPEDRAQFLLMVKKKSGNQQVIFKLHPNEDHGRAIKEIRREFPDALIFTDGNILPMIANCKLMMTHSSSVIFPAVAMGKEVISSQNLNVMKKLLPIQNGGRSAGLIAKHCKELMSVPRERRVASKQTVNWRIEDVLRNL